MHKSGIHHEELRTTRRSMGMRFASRPFSFKFNCTTEARRNRVRYLEKPGGTRNLRPLITSGVQRLLTLETKESRNVDVLFRICPQVPTTRCLSWRDAIGETSRSLGR